MTIQRFRTDPRFANCPNAFLVTGKRNDAALDKKNRTLLSQNKTGHWKIAQGRVQAGDAIFLVLPSQLSTNGYPRAIHGGVVTAVQRNATGGTEIDVAAFHHLIDVPTRISEFLQGKTSPQGNTALHVWSADDHEVSDEDSIEDEIRARQDIGATQKSQLIQARRGQGVFKRNVAGIERHCRLTGVSDLAHLIASHIKPWKDSSDEERLDGCNGLLLAPHVDHLFDLGLISFADDGTLLVSPELDPDILKQWSIPGKANVGAFSQKQAAFLRYHRDEIFQA